MYSHSLTIQTHLRHPVFFPNSLTVKPLAMYQLTVAQTVGGRGVPTRPESCHSTALVADVRPWVGSGRPDLLQSALFAEWLLCFSFARYASGRTFPRRKRHRPTAVERASISRGTLVPQLRNARLATAERHHSGRCDTTFCHVFLNFSADDLCNSIFYSTFVAQNTRQPTKTTNSYEQQLPI